MDRVRKTLGYSLLFLAFCSWTVEPAQPQETRTRGQVIAKFSGRVPREWGEVVQGVKTRLNTDQKVLALTFDACGGPKGSGYDAMLIDFLNREAIPATLFISGKWVDANPDLLRALSRNPLFEIENHGLNHKPCSAIGRSAYGIRGTKDVGEVFDEIQLNALKIQSIAGRITKYYRPGTTHSDEVCVEIAKTLGYETVNFSVRGDAGATYSKKEIREALLHSAPASIVLMHMNQPESQTAQGVIETVPELRNRGFRFVKVSDFGLK
jgi:peptidoglycan/xylan/chitin deacetylase (PgdA/CDA1 family)